MNLQDAENEVAHYMDEILKCFKGGQKITVLVRTPEKDTADFLMTNDDLEEAKKLIQRRIERGDEAERTKGSNTEVNK